ncbi:MAG: universal stress protein [Deltaproteobacteria bacterium]|nr:universal stress protein [Deltaproteobacteria bacterium]
METIVVGVDGSECAHRALLFAAEEAVFRQAALRVVCAWTLPVSVNVAGGLGPLDSSVVTAFRDAARKTVDEAVAEVRRRQPHLEVVGRVVNDQPAKAIIDQARGATLAVVGSRGRGGFASLLLGSVSRETVEHAPCPVVVIRGSGHA